MARRDLVLVMLESTKVQKRSFQKASHKQGPSRHHQDRAHEDSNHPEEADKPSNQKETDSGLLLA